MRTTHLGAAGRTGADLTPAGPESLALLQHEDHGWDSWQALLDDAEPMVQTPSAAGEELRVPRPRERFRMPLATRAETAEFGEWAGQAGVPLGVALLALLGRSVAAHETSGRFTLRALLPGALVIGLDAREPLERAVARTWAACRDVDPAGSPPGSDTEHRLPGHGSCAWVSYSPQGTFLEAQHPSSPQCSAWMATVAVGMRRGLLAAVAPTVPVVGPRGLHNRFG